MKLAVLWGKKVKVLVAYSCPTLYKPMDYNPPGPSVHEFSRQEYWSGLPFPSPGDISKPGIEPQVSCIAGRYFTIRTTMGAL